MIDVLGVAKKTAATRIGIRATIKIEPAANDADTPGNPPLQAACPFEPLTLPYHSRRNIETANSLYPFSSGIAAGGWRNPGGGLIWKIFLFFIPVFVQVEIDAEDGGEPGRGQILRVVSG